MIYISLVAVLGLFGLSYGSISVWIPIGFLFIGVVLVDMIRRLRIGPPLIQMATCVYFIQFLGASLYLYFHPALPKLWKVDIPAYRYETYLSYVIPGMIGLYLGGLLGMSRLKTGSPTSEKEEWPEWSRYGVALLVIGLAASMLRPVVNTGSITFVVMLLDGLRWVGVYTLILRRDRYCWRYTALVFFVEASTALSSVMFHEIILWTECLLLIVAFRYQWRFRLLLALLAASIVVLSIQNIKESLRTVIWRSASSDTMSAVRSSVSEELAGSSSSSSDTSMGFDMIRFNQGWIVDRVMRRVPGIVPYAGGSTFADVLEAVVLPRFVDASKAVAGGKALFEKYTGRTLHGTSMNISVMGEMYANFGPIVGAVGMGVFGLLLGLVYRFLASAAGHSSAWWAWGPYLLLWAMKPEEDFMNILNWIAKAAVIMAIVVYLANRQTRRGPNAVPPVRPV